MFKARSAQEAATYCKPFIIDYLESRGIRTTPNGGTANFYCFDTAHHNGGNRAPSMQYNESTNTCYCHQAGKTYDIFNACEILEGKNKSEAFKTVLDFCNCEIENGTEGAGSGRPEPVKREEETREKIYRDYSAYINACRERMATEAGRPALEYLKGRGISEMTISSFNIGYDPDGKGGPFIVFGHTNGKGYNARNLTEPGAENRQFLKGKDQLPGGFFGTPGALEAETDAPLFICEGEIDALSLAETGVDVIALSGIAYKELVKHDIKRPVILALDNDQAGRAAAGKIKKALQEEKRAAYIVNLYGKEKDANAALLNAPTELFEKIRNAWTDPETAGAEETAREYIETHSAAALIAPFLKHIETARPSIPTGFDNLDAALDGGIFPGLYVLGAISSLGKTSLCLQIADNIAETGRDVLFFSLEMSKYELMARSISRKTFNPEGDRRTAKTARAIMQNEIDYNAADRATFENAVKEYAETAKHLFIREGLGTVTAATVREAIEEHKAATGAAPIIFIDYLQILAPMGERLSDKQATDAAILELKRISRDYNIPVFAISSFNRESYKKTSENRGAVTMTDFKESGSLEYSADVLIGLQFTTAGTGEYNESAEKKKDPREIRAVILKNRNGKTWGTADLAYFPKFNAFFEEDENPFTENVNSQADAERQTAPKGRKRKELQGRAIDNVFYYLSQSNRGGAVTVQDFAEYLNTDNEQAKNEIIEAGGFEINGDIVTRL